MHSAPHTPRVTVDALRRQAMGIWLELGVFGIVLAFAFWQMHDVRKAQEETRRQREREKERSKDPIEPP
jgi:Flp pilus assembly protein TadB